MTLWRQSIRSDKKQSGSNHLKQYLIMDLRKKFCTDDIWTFLNYLDALYIIYMRIQILCGYLKTCLKFQFTMLVQSRLAIWGNSTPSAACSQFNFLYFVRNYCLGFIYLQFHCSCCVQGKLHCVLKGVITYKRPYQKICHLECFHFHREGFY